MLATWRRIFSSFQARSFCSRNCQRFFRSEKVQILPSPVEYIWVSRLSSFIKCRVMTNDYLTCISIIPICRFQRIHHGPNKGGYCHTLFKRSKPHMCRLISRQGDSQRAPASVAANAASPKAPEVSVRRARAVSTLNRG